LRDLDIAGGKKSGFKSLCACGEHNTNRRAKISLSGVFFVFLRAIAPFAVNSFFTNQVSKTLAIPLPIN